MQKKEMVFVDWTKAIGIFLIIIGHFVPEGNVVRVVLYSFHVPIFLVVAGITYNVQYTMKARMGKLIKRILVPYLVWFVISTLPFIVAGKMTFGGLLKQLIFLEGKMIWNSALWFLPCYFISFILFGLSVRLLQKKQRIVPLISVIAFLIFLLLNENVSGVIYFGLDKCFLFVGFIGVGFSLKNFFQNDNKAIIIVSSIIFVASAIVVAIINNGDNISILNRDFNNVYLFVCFAVILSITFIKICKILPKINIVKTLSRNSLFIMCSHLFVRLIINYLGFQTNVVTGIILSVLILCCYLVILSVISKNFISKWKWLRIFGLK